MPNSDISQILGSTDIFSNGNMSQVFCVLYEHIDVTKIYSNKALLPALETKSINSLIYLLADTFYLNINEYHIVVLLLFVFKKTKIPHVGLQNGYGAIK